MILTICIFGLIYSISMLIKMHWLAKEINEVHNFLRDKININEELITVLKSIAADDQLDVINKEIKFNEIKKIIENNSENYEKIFYILTKHIDNQLESWNPWDYSSWRSYAIPVFHEYKEDIYKAIIKDN